MSFSTGPKPGPDDSGVPAPKGGPLTTAISADEFASRFLASSRVFWLIAVGIVSDSSAAEDVLQEAAIVALKKLDQFRPDSNFRAWVGAIVRNVALNAVRSERRRKGTVGPWSDSFEPMEEKDLVSSHLRDADPLFDGKVAAALANVGDVARACLLLRTVGDLPYAEIAALLEIPEGTAMSHVHRARAQLRERLAGVWEEHAAGEGTPGIA